MEGGRKRREERDGEREEKWEKEGGGVDEREAIGRRKERTQEGKEMGERVGGRERKNDKEEGGGRTEEGMKGRRRREQKVEIDVEEETGCDRLYMIMYMSICTTKIHDFIYL